MNFVNTIISKKDYAEKTEHDGLIIVHLDPVEDGDTIQCVETIVTNYDEDAINAAYEAWKEKLNTFKLKAAKESKIEEIATYDTSDAVNSFSIQGIQMWLNRDDRNALMRRFEAEQASGITDTTLWYGTNSFSLTVANAITMLNSIEVYACQCYDVTAQHKASVEKLTTLEEVESYDYKAGYPDKISL